MKAPFAIPIFCALAAGQSFEVASVKPHPASATNFVRMRMNGGPGSTDPGRIDYENVSMKDLLAKAFGVREYQISAPSWTESERYDVTAKLPPTTDEPAFRLMLLTLLKERFGLEFHRDTREQPAYVLVVARTGPKMKEAPDVSGSQQAGEQPAQPLPASPQYLKMGRDGFPEMPKGRGSDMMIMMPGRARLSMTAGIPQFIDRIAGQVDRPIIDQTGLKARYEIELTFEPDFSKMPAPPGGKADPPEGEAAPNLFTAIQEQLGLKLEARKAPVDTIFVDKLERIPSGN